MDTANISSMGSENQNDTYDTFNSIDSDDTKINDNNYNTDKVSVGVNGTSSTNKDFDDDENDDNFYNTEDNKLYEVATKLIEAIDMWDMDTIETILMQYPNLIQQCPLLYDTKWTDDTNGMSLLHYVCSSKSIRAPPVSFIKKLIHQYPLSVQQCDIHKRYPLHYACCSHPYDPQNTSSLSSSSSSWEDIIVLLVHLYPQAVQEVDTDQRYPLHYYAFSCSTTNVQSGSILQLLMNTYPEALEKEDNCGLYPFHIACMQEDQSESILQLYIHKNPDVLQYRAGSTIGLTPLQYVIIHNSQLVSSESILHYLIQQNQMTESFRTFYYWNELSELQYAIRYCPYESIIHSLIEQYPKLDFYPWTTTATSRTTDNNFDEDSTTRHNKKTKNYDVRTMYEGLDYVLSRTELTNLMFYPLSILTKNKERMEQFGQLLATSLPYNTFLQRIHFANEMKWKLSNRFIQLLCTGLRTNRSIKTLRIGLESTDSLILFCTDAVQYNQSITELYITLHNLRNDGLMAIVQALEYNDTIRTIEIITKQYNITNTINDRVYESLYEYNDTIQRFYVETPDKRSQSIVYYDTIQPIINQNKYSNRIAPTKARIRRHTIYFWLAKNPEFF